MTYECKVGSLFGTESTNESIAEEAFFMALCFTARANTPRRLSQFLERGWSLGIATLKRALSKTFSLSTINDCISFGSSQNIGSRVCASLYGYDSGCLSPIRTSFIFIQIISLILRIVIKIWQAVKLPTHNSAICQRSQNTSASGVVTKQISSLTCIAIFSWRKRSAHRQRIWSILPTISRTTSWRTENIVKNKNLSMLLERSTWKSTTSL